MQINEPSNFHLEHEGEFPLIQTGNGKIVINTGCFLSWKCHSGKNKTRNKLDNFAGKGRPEIGQLIWGQNSPRGFWRRGAMLPITAAILYYKKIETQSSLRLTSQQKCQQREMAVHSTPPRWKKLKKKNWKKKEYHHYFNSSLTGWRESRSGSQGEEAGLRDEGCPYLNVIVPLVPCFSSDLPPSLSIRTPVVQLDPQASQRIAQYLCAAFSSDLPPIPSVRTRPPVFQSLGRIGVVECFSNTTAGEENCTLKLFLLNYHH